MSRINWLTSLFLSMACLVVIAYGCTKENIEKAEKEKAQADQSAAAPQAPASDKTVNEPAGGLRPRRERPRSESMDRMGGPGGGPGDRRPGASNLRGRGPLGSQWTDNPPSGLSQCTAHPTALGAVEIENMPGRFTCPPELPTDRVCGYFTLENDTEAGRAYYQTFKNECILCARTYSQDGVIPMRGQTYKFLGYQKGDCSAGLE